MTMYELANILVLLALFLAVIVLILLIPLIIKNLRNTPSKKEPQKDNKPNNFFKDIWNDYSQFYEEPKNNPETTSQLVNNQTIKEPDNINNYFENKEEVNTTYQADNKPVNKQNDFWSKNSKDYSIFNEEPKNYNDTVSQSNNKEIANIQSNNSQTTSETDNYFWDEKEIDTTFQSQKKEPDTYFQADNSQTIKEPDNLDNYFLDNKDFQADETPDYPKVITEKDLREMRPAVRYKNKTGTTLKILQQELKEKAEEYQIPIAFYKGKVYYGGLIGGGSDECLVIYHPYKENDYFKLAIRIKYQGTYAFVTVHDFGKSKLLNYEMNKSALKDAWNSQSGDLAMLGAIIKTANSKIRSTGKRNALEEEKQWYAIIEDILDEVINIKS